MFIHLPLDITEEILSESPVLEKEPDLPSEIKSHPRETEQSLPQPERSLHEPELTLSEPKLSQPEPKPSQPEPKPRLPESSLSSHNQNGSTNEIFSDSPPESDWLPSDTPKDVSRETKAPVTKLSDDAPRVSVTESSTMYASVNKPPVGFQVMNKKEQPNSEVINEIESILFIGFTCS